MLGTVFHYAVIQPRIDHRDCDGQVREIVAWHERNGYRRGGAYNGHFCWHGGIWVQYLGPNQATGHTWANLNLHAWCYLGTVDTPVTPAAAQAAYDLTLVEPTGRDRIHSHSDFFATSCCGDPLRAWIAAGALPPVTAPTPTRRHAMEMIVHNTTDPAVRTALFVQGNVIVREITDGINEFGVPRNASNWREAIGGANPAWPMPITFLTGVYDGPAVEAIRLGSVRQLAAPPSGGGVSIGEIEALLNRQRVVTR